MKKTSIQSVVAKQSYDSRGNPTLEVTVSTELGKFIASVPSGASTGMYEAVELRDGDPRYFGGKGVKKAIHNVNSIIGPALIGRDPTNQRSIDEYMVRELDKSENEWGWCKSKLGANAILGVSMAVCRAGAAARTMPLYEYIHMLTEEIKLQQISHPTLSPSYIPKPEFNLPVPSFNIINGGAHAGNKLLVQEFMILPVGAKSFNEAMRIASEVYMTLKKIISKKFGDSDTNVGDEGGFAPNIGNEVGKNALNPYMNSMNEALDLICEAINQCKYQGIVQLGMDIAASEFYDKDMHMYDLKKKTHGVGGSDLPFSPPKPLEEKGRYVTSRELIEIYRDLLSRYPIISIEDGFDENDLEGWSMFYRELGARVEIIGDDLTVTNMRRIQLAEENKCCNSLLLKINQIGSITEAMEAVMLCRKYGWKVMTSHRSGETQDDFIADAAVGLGTEKIKSGAPARGERLIKYIRLMRIEDELLDAGKHVTYNGVTVTRFEY